MKNKKLFYGILIALIIFVGIGLFMLSKHATIPTSESQIIVKQSGGQDLLIAECSDKNYLSNTAEYIIEGTAEKVEIKGTFTYTYLKINNYVKGAPLAEDKLQIVTHGGNGLFVEDQAIFYEGKEVRIYFQEEDGEFSIMCGIMGVEEISENLSYRVYDGCNLEGKQGTPVSESVDVSQVEDSIKIEQSIQIPYCSPQKNLKLSYSQFNNNIEIKEIFDTNETESECTMPVCSVYLWGQIDSLKKGNYTITFVFEDHYTNETKILAEKEFELK